MGRLCPLAGPKWVRESTIPGTLAMSLHQGPGMELAAVSALRVFTSMQVNT
jgi:hypothetical protein